MLNKIFLAMVCIIGLHSFWNAAAIMLTQVEYHMDTFIFFLEWGHWRLFYAISPMAQMLKICHYCKIYSWLYWTIWSVSKSVYLLVVHDVLSVKRTLWPLFLKNPKKLNVYCHSYHTVSVRFLCILQYLRGQLGSHRMYEKDELKHSLDDISLILLNASECSVLKYGWFIKR